ncbi:MAG TPA: transposase [Blastocatellia bacterium]|nr:transposase [Blastocatellia bacterium]
MLLESMVRLMQGWRQVFAQGRTTNRAIRQALSSICVVGRRTIARSYLVRGGEGDWSSEYKLHSRSEWEAQALFGPLLEAAIEQVEGDVLAFGTDDTRLKKSGKNVASAHWGRDPFSPPFRHQRQWGLRYLHTSLLLPLHGGSEVSARAIPVWFEAVAPVPKPSRQASPQEQVAYRRAVKAENLSQRSVWMLRELRQRVDAAGGREKKLGVALDGSFCNQTLFKAELERTLLIARCRRDAVLCHPAATSRRRYGVEKFRPEQVRTDEARAWQRARIFHGQTWREVLWQRGGGERRLRLPVVRATPYRQTKKGRVLYRQPAFLLTTDLERPAAELLQIYFDRWQVEVAHKEMKESFGIGEAQVRVARAVEREPVLRVATYSALHLAALQQFGAERSARLGTLPKYQREKKRASCQDLIRHLRSEVVQQLPYDLKITEKSILQAATR